MMCAFEVLARHRAPASDVRQFASLLQASLFKEQPLHPGINLVSGGDGSFLQCHELLRDRASALSVCDKPVQAHSGYPQQFAELNLGRRQRPLPGAVFYKVPTCIDSSPGAGSLRLQLILHPPCSWKDKKVSLEPRSNAYVA